MKRQTRKKAFLITILWFSYWIPGSNLVADEVAPNLVLVTLDGVRWQEVFAGVDMKLIEDERYTNAPEHLKEFYWSDEREERRKLLFPFLWSVIASQGTLIGDRTRNSFMNVSNGWWFSYPGYNEILTGKADPVIDSNDKNWNQNVTFLEALNGLPEFENRVLAFGSWDVFPYIINTQRSGVPVNAGFAIDSSATTEKSRWLNEVSAAAPELWSTVRLDFLTHGYAMQALETRRPRVLYIAYGETDDFAHDGSYDRYIDAAHRTDEMLSKLWEWLQADPVYRDNTTLLITTDHGRGNTPDGWQHHASPGATEKLGVENAPNGVVGSDQTWFAAIGPNIKSDGSTNGQWTQSQIAATALLSVQLEPEKIMPHADNAMHELLH